MKKKVFMTLKFWGLGLFLGFLSRIFDLYTTTLGNIFLEFSIWILIGVLLSRTSKTPKEASLKVFIFSIGMLITYYLTAIITKGVYSRMFIQGWTIFAFCTPILAYLTFMTKRKTLFAKVISISIIIFTYLASKIIFQGPRFYDIMILFLLIFIFYFPKKI